MPAHLISYDGGGLLKFGLFILPYISPDIILANMMKSMLQELDNNLLSKDNFIHEQTAKLVEKDKIIQNNKAEIERIEKKNRAQEHKVEN